MAVLNHECRNFAKLYVGKDMNETIGRIRTVGLWIFGRPYKRGGT